MSDQFGFDFGEETPGVTLIEDPAGSWTTPEFTTEQYEHIFLLAQQTLVDIIWPVRNLFELGLTRAKAVQCGMLRRGVGQGAQATYSLWRTDIEMDDPSLQAFVRHCMDMIDGHWDSPGIDYKRRDDLSHSTVAMHWAKAGTVIVRIWAQGNVAVDYVPWRDDFFLPSYRDGERRVMTPSQAFAASRASQTLGESRDITATVIPFEFEGRQYIKMGATYSAQAHTCMAWTFCAASDWSGPTYSYRSLISAWDEGRKERGDCRGLVVLVRGQRVVMDGYTEFVDQSPNKGIPRSSDANTDADGEVEAINGKGAE